MKNFLIISLLSLLSTDTAGQLIFGIKYTGLAFHPNPYNGKIFRGKLNKKGHLVLNGGFSITANYFITKHVGIGLGQTVMPQDCGGKWFGATQVGMALKKDFGLNQTISGVVGPIMFYRQNWANILGYQDDIFFKKSQNQRIQYKFVWYGGHLEYTYWFTNRVGATLNLLPGIPEIFELSPGFNIRPEPQ